MVFRIFDFRVECTTGVFFFNRFTLNVKLLRFDVDRLAIVDDLAVPIFVQFKSEDFLFDAPNTFVFVVAVFENVFRLAVLGVQRESTVALVAEDKI